MARPKRSRSGPSDSYAVLAEVRKDADQALYQKARDTNVQDLRKFQVGSVTSGQARKHVSVKERVSNMR